MFRVDQFRTMEKHARVARLTLDKAKSFEDLDSGYYAALALLVLLLGCLFNIELNVIN